MPSPLPGMDPYLEHPSAWPNVHHRLITAIADDLAPKILPKYQILVEERIYQVEREDSILIGAPDVTVQSLRKFTNDQQSSSPITHAMAIAEPISEPIAITLTIPDTIKQGYLEVREIATGEVVTVIEVLSPVNKRKGKGRIDYENKRSMIFNSTSHLVEIDLLRQGQPMTIDQEPIPFDYRILVSPQEKRPQADLYAFNLPDRIPTFPLPLRGDDLTPTINLRSLLDGIYDRSGYGFVIDYNQEPIPSLPKEDLKWMHDYLS